jgi:hypothetical protein
MRILLKTSLALSILAIFAPMAHASIVTTPFALDVSSKSVDDLLASSDAIQNPKGELLIPVDDQQIQSPYQVNLNGITLDLKYDFQKPQLSADYGQWTLQSNDLSAELVVKMIDATQIIEIHQGGSTLKVRINASCSDVHLSLASGRTHAEGKISFSLVNGKPILKLSEFTAGWTADSWTVTSMNCQGPDGFDKLVAQTASDQLRLIDPSLPAIKEQIQKKLDALANEDLSFTFNVANPNPQEQPILLTLKPQSFTNEPNDRLLMEGNAAITFPGANDQCNSTARGDFNPAKTPLTRDVLVLPFEVVNDIVDCTSQDPSFDIHLSSDDIPFFSLLDHTPLGLFFWPDLMRYFFDYGATFDFELGLTGFPKIGIPVSTESNNIDVDVSVPFKVAVKNPSHEPYVNFTTALNGPTHWKFEGNKVSITQNIKKLKVNVEWDKQYVAEHDPDQWINKHSVASHIKDFLKSPGLQYSIPDFEINQALKLTADGMELKDGNLFLGLKLNSLK